MAADPSGFLKYRRQDTPVRPPSERVADWDPVIELPDDSIVRQNATRCMECGIAFCEHACPLGNRLPHLNALVADGHWREALEHLHATNNFPEFTGWLCPAPCETACVLAINDEGVTARQLEVALVEEGFRQAWITPIRPHRTTDHRVAVVGSGPAGLAAAQQLTRAGHHVIVFERADRLGGLLRYGVPDFRMEKSAIDRRIEQLRAEGTGFSPGSDVGRDPDVEELLDAFDAVVLACGAPRPRRLNVPGADLAGVHQGMAYLVAANRVQAGDLDRPPVDAAGRHVAIIGGGDTASDCLATAHRQGAASVRVLDHNPVPPETRDPSTNPWPQLPKVHKHGFAQEEGVIEEWQAEIRELVPDGQARVRAIRGDRVNAVWTEGVRSFEAIPGGEFELETDLVLLAMGFEGPDPGPLLDDLGVELGDDATLVVDGDWRTTNERVFACGDASRGASLVAWAIAEGRACAASVHAALTGRDTLPRTVAPHDQPL